MNALFQNRVGRVVQAGQTDFITREVMAPEPDEVVIQVKASALCGSDLHIFKAAHPTVSLPATIGHEFAGDIVAKGSGVRNVALGDRVTVEPCIVCGTCDACRHGEYGYCEHISFTYRNGDGAMADYVTVKAANVYKLPEELSYEAGALIEPLAVAVHAVRRADIKMGETVLVLGAGAIGLFVAALCKRSGAKEVVVSDYAGFRLDMAEKLGATHTVNPGEGGSVEDTVQELTHGKGMDKVFECVGREATFVQAMTSLKRNGLATIVGIFEQTEITIPVMRFINYEIKVQGSQGYCWDFPVAMQMARDIDLSGMVTHTFPLSELQKALEISADRNQNTIKVVLKP